MRLLILSILIFSSVPTWSQFKKVEFSDSDQTQESTILKESKPVIKATFSQIIEDGISTRQWSKLPERQREGLAYGVNQYSGVKYVSLDQVTAERSNPQVLLSKFSELVNIKNLEDNVVIHSSWSDDYGHTHLRFHQTRNGIKVYNSESILHIDEAGVVSMQSNMLPDSRILPASKSGLSEEQVKQLVIAELDHYHEIDDNLSHLIGDEQWVIEQVYFQKKDGDVVLAYYVDVYANVGEHQQFIVSADTGQFLDQFSKVCKFHGHSCSLPPDGEATANASDLFGLNRTINTYEVGNTFYLLDGSRTMFQGGQSNMPNEPVGVIWTIDAFNTAPQNSNFTYDHVTSGNNSWSDKETAVSAHYNSGLSYEYFKNVHSREAIDGNGGNIVSIINVANEDGSSMGNAFWNGAAMFYGNGDSAFRPLGRGLDVAGHELTHGVIQNTANLEYQGESGALNESFADVFGAMIDDADQEWYLIGEEVVKTNAFPSGALRNLKDPHNGASTGDFGSGWQPSHYSERFTGSQDNGGVHINSGIPNRAFYLFAEAVGNQTAEKVYYRALTTYLTRSSQFVDCRNAVVQAAADMGMQSIVDAANSAFDQVGIGSAGGTTVEDAMENLGADFVMWSPPDLSQINLADGVGEDINNPFIEENIKSKPSASDDGTRIVFVGSDSRIYLVEIDWNAGSFSYDVFDDQAVWRNVVISKDGLRLAAIANQEENFVYIYDFESNQTQPYELYNPTFSEGVSTGDVLYADAMEFDITGKYLMYDANNSITSNSSGAINYWDIGFLEVWDRANDQFGNGNIQKLFSALPEGVSIGNPTFSKNSPYIIAFDVLEDNLYTVVGYNIETGDLGIIMENSDLGYPNFSRDDSKVIFDFPWIFGLDLGVVTLNSDKITAVSNSEDVFIVGGKWGTWFSNGVRNLYVDTDDIVQEYTVSISPNPVVDQLEIAIDGMDCDHLVIQDNLGRTVAQFDMQAQVQTLTLSNLNTGLYSISLLYKGEIVHTDKFIKQ